MDICVKALKKLTTTDKKWIRLYNAYVDLNKIPPEKVVKYLKILLGKDGFKEYDWLDCPLDIKDDKIIEIDIEKENYDTYETIIHLDKLPKGTYALKVWKT